MVTEHRGADWRGLGLRAAATGPRHRARGVGGRIGTGRGDRCGGRRDGAGQRPADRADRSRIPVNRVTLPIAGSRLGGGRRRRRRSAGPPLAILYQHHHPWVLRPTLAAYFVDRRRAEPAWASAHRGPARRREFALLARAALADAGARASRCAVPVRRRVPIAPDPERRCSSSVPPPPWRSWSARSSELFRWSLAGAVWTCPSAAGGRQRLPRDHRRRRQPRDPADRGDRGRRLDRPDAGVPLGSSGSRDFGPLFVAIDAHGGSQYQAVKDRAAERLAADDEGTGGLVSRAAPCQGPWNRPRRTLTA